MAASSLSLTADSAHPKPLNIVITCQHSTHPSQLPELPLPPGNRPLKHPIYIPLSRPLVHNGDSAILWEQPSPSQLSHPTPPPTGGRIPCTTLDGLIDATDPNDRPPYPYATILRFCIGGSPKGKMTLDEIYAAMMARFAYYRNEDQGWRNSVRHALSMNTVFKQTKKPLNVPGRGNYWMLDSENLQGGSRRDRTKRANKDAAVAASAVDSAGVPKPRRGRKAFNPASLLPPEPPQIKPPPSPADPSGPNLPVRTGKSYAPQHEVNALPLPLQPPHPPPPPPSPPVAPTYFPALPHYAHHPGTIPGYNPGPTPPPPPPPPLPPSHYPPGYHRHPSYARDRSYHPYNPPGPPPAYRTTGRTRSPTVSDVDVDMVSDIDSECSMSSCSRRSQSVSPMDEEVPYAYPPPTELPYTEPPPAETNGHAEMRRIDYSAPPQQAESVSRESLSRPFLYTRFHQSKPSNQLILPPPRNHLIDAIATIQRASEASEFQTYAGSFQSNPSTQAHSFLPAVTSPTRDRGNLPITTTNGGYSPDGRRRSGRSSVTVAAAAPRTNTINGTPARYRNGPASVEVTPRHNEGYYAHSPPATHFTGYSHSRSGSGAAGVETRARRQSLTQSRRSSSASSTERFRLRPVRP